MAVKLCDIKPGSVLRTKDSTYVYLGYYKGIPRPSSGFTLDTEGYLYACLDVVPEDKLSDSVEICRELVDLALEHYGNGTGCFTRRAKTFVHKVCDVDLGPVRHTLSGMWGLKRLGDKRPGKS